MIIREILLDYVRQYPATFFRVVSCKSKYDGLLADEATDIVIEGYPRCANTFAVAAFELAQPRRMKIARHTHAVAQLKRAAALGLPALVLIREPSEAILSYVIREENTTLRIALNRYLTFYRAVEQLRESFVIADFSEVIRDFGQVVRRVNKRYGSDFSVFEHTEENTEQVFRRVEEMERQHAGGVLLESKVSRPSNARASQKAELAEQLAERWFQPDLHRCEALYQSLTVTEREG